MGDTLEQRLRPIMSGEDRGVSARVYRGLLRLAEIPYAIVVRVRSWMYDRRLGKIVHLAKPVISVGNITTGGTGKTPVVRWLLEKFSDEGFRPAVLMRGYRSSGGQSDEQVLLSSSAASDRDSPQRLVIAEPDRARGAAKALAIQADTNLFILDDAMQHRRVHRDFELVLINAADPFGFGHLLPRGLLREPLSGLKRADAFVITHAEQADEQTVQRIRQELQKYNAAAPVYRAEHVITGFAHEGELLEPRAIRGKRVFLFCGIGHPESFAAQVQDMGAEIVGRRWFPDHYGYAARDLDEVVAKASAGGAEVLLTTAKDWVKLRKLGRPAMPPIWRAELEIDFSGNDAAELWGEIKKIVVGVKSS